MLSPIVERTIIQLNQLFVERVGPVGDDLAQEAFNSWFSAGKHRPSALRAYATALGSYFDTPKERQEFIAKSDLLLLTTQASF
jgi:hypothetical protein